MEVLERTQDEPPPSVKPPTPWSALAEKRWPIGIAIFLFSLALRLIGLDWGLPNESHHWSRHPDEPVIFAYSQQIKPAEGKFTPGFYNYGTLYLTTLRVATDVVNAYGGGPVQKDPDSAARALANYHRAGRFINVLAGAGLAWAVFALLRRRTNTFGAMVGGIAIALAPGLVVHSRFQTVDVLATFLLTMGIAYAVRLVDDASQKEWLKWAVVAGLFFGLSAGTKYTGLLGLLALGAVCLSGQKWKELALGVATCLVTFVIVTPGCILESEKFWKDFRFEMAHTTGGHGLVFAGTGPGFIYHAVNLAIGFGAILSLMGVVGLVRAGYRRQVWALALCLFGLAYYLLIGRAEVKFLRYTFPLMPVLAVGTGWLAGRAHENPDRRWRVVGFASVMGLGGLFGGGGATALQATAVMATPQSDLRSSLVSLVKDGTVGLVSDPWFYTPDFYPEAGAPRWVPFPQRDAEMRSATSPKIERYVPTNPDERQDWDTRLLDLAPTYIVYSSFETEGLARMAARDNVLPEFKGQVDRYREFQVRLTRDYDLALTDQNNPWVVVHDLMYIRPTLWVWKRKTDLKTPSNGSSTTSSTSEAPAATR